MKERFKKISDELDDLQEEVVILNLKLEAAKELIRLNVHENVANAIIKDIDAIGEK